MGLANITSSLTKPMVFASLYWARPLPTNTHIPGLWGGSAFKMIIMVSSASTLISISYGLQKPKLGPSQPVFSATSSDWDRGELLLFSISSDFLQCNSSVISVVGMGQEHQPEKCIVLEMVINLLSFVPLLTVASLLAQPISLQWPKAHLTIYYMALHYLALGGVGTIIMEIKRNIF